MRHVAVIGAGIAGLAAAYLLSRRHGCRCSSGPSGSAVIPTPCSSTPLAGRSLDTGFLVHNEQTYPNLVRLFAEIGIETSPSDMSFSVQLSAPPASSTAAAA